MYNPKNTCYLCGSNEHILIHKGVRGDQNTNVLKCSKCGLVRLDKFITNEDDTFYEESGMWQSNGMESEIIKARIDAKADDDRRAEFVRNYIINKRVLDFGCGSGGFIHGVKSFATYVAGVELERDKRDYLISEGIDCFPSVDEIPDEKYDVITLFHVLEHLPEPIEILDKLEKHLSQGGKMIIEVPNADDALLSKYKSDSFADFTYWVCHLFLYTNKTLTELIEKCHMRVSFIQQIQRYPLSNHLYWLSHNKPGGHKEWAAFNDPEMDSLYGKHLSRLGIADTIMAVVEKE